MRRTMRTCVCPAITSRSPLASKIFNVSLIVFFAVIVLYLLRRVGEFAERASEWLEDNPHRLDAQLAAADLVVCHAGSLNHNAYARVLQSRTRSPSERPSRRAEKKPTGASST